MENNYIISIGRRIGAGGLATAYKLSEELGIKVYDKELLKEVAKQSGLASEFFEKRDEKASGGRLGALSSFKSLFSGESRATTDSVMTEEGLFKVQSDVMRNIARTESCIIVGRCADYILRDHPRILSVFITASIESRIKRISAARGMDETSARRFIEQGDRKRAAYYDYFTFKKWGDSASYDLCIDSSALGDDIGKVVEIIKLYMKQTNLI